MVGSLPSLLAGPVILASPTGTGTQMRQGRLGVDDSKVQPVGFSCGGQTPGQA